MYNLFIALLTFISSLSFSPTIAPSNVTVVATPEVAENSILSYYYAIPSQYFIKDLIAKTKDERKAVLDKLIDDEHMGKNKELFSGENKNYKKDNSDNMLAVVDEGNYYLRMNPNESYGDWSQGFEMTVFIKSNGEHLIAVESHDCGLWCGPGNSKIFFLTYKNNEWTDVTAEFLPTEKINNLAENEVKRCEKLNTDSNGKYGTVEEVHKRCVDEHAGVVYTLPQNGTTILGDAGETDFTNFKLDWKNDKFEFGLVSQPN